MTHSEEVDSSFLIQAFPEAKMLKGNLESIASSVTNERLLALLTQVGIPDSLLDVVEFDDSIDLRLRTVRDVYKRGATRAPLYSEELFFLGFAGDALIGIDGLEGTVYQVHESFGVRPLAQSLDVLLSVLASFSIIVREHWIGGVGALAERLRASAFEILSHRNDNQLVISRKAWEELCDQVAAAAG